MTKPSNSRRDFLKTSVAASAAASIPYYFSPSSVLASETKARNDRIPIGLIGAGGMGIGNMNSAKDFVDVVAISDVDSDRMNSANKKLSNGKATTHADYREILENDDIKIVHIATPDHWHTKPLIEAMLAGKDIYCEKPLTLTIDEGKLIRKIQKQTGRIVQVGTQQRSTFPLFTKAIALVQQGRLGKIKRIQCAIGGAPNSPAIPVAEAPAAIDWDRWLGPVPAVDYRALPKGKGRPYSNCHYEFRWWYEYSGGKLTDWGAHHVDIANWALQVNGQTDGPLSIGGTATHPVEYKNGVPSKTDCYNTATKFNFKLKFPGDVEIEIRDDTSNGLLIEGDKGRIFVSRGSLKGKPVEDLVDNPLPDDAIQMAYKGLPMEFNERQAHWANFLHCHREQIEPISDVHSHMQMLNYCHLAGITARLGRDLNWDAASETITGDDEANSMLARPYRKGYEIEMQERVTS
jgi:predicted dehydrogenase